MKQKSFTRNELYELIWEKPMNNFISIYGGNYAEVKTMLAKHDIPVPPGGYWSKIRQGVAVSKTPLPPNPNIPETIIYSPKEKKIISNGSGMNQPIAQNIPVDELVVDAKKDYLERAKNPRPGKLISVSHTSLNITVSQPLLDRALNFFNYLIFEVKRNTGQVRLGPTSSYVTIEGIDFDISVREKNNRVTKTSNSIFDKFDYHPSGILIAKAGISRWTSKEWIDTPGNGIESKTQHIVQYLIQAAITRKEDTKRRELERVKEIEQRQIAINFNRRRESEIAKFLNFKRDFEKWDTSNRMRSYLAELERSAIDNNTFDETLRNYINWANEKIEWYDPIVNKSDELLDDVNKDTLDLKERSFL